MARSIEFILTNDTLTLKQSSSSEEEINPQEQTKE